MSRVEWGSSSELTTGGAASTEWPRGVAARVGRVSDVYARRIAAGGLLLTFTLLAASQTRSWFSIGDSGGSGDFGLPTAGKRTVGAVTALNSLVTAYYLGWTLILMAIAVAVFGRRQIRRLAAGVAGGAVAGQAIVMVAVWHDNGVALYRSLIGQETTVHGHREAGFYLALAALVMAASAVVVAVRGRILPSLQDDLNTSDSTPAVPVAADRPIAMVPVSAPGTMVSETGDDLTPRPRPAAPEIQAAEPVNDVMLIGSPDSNAASAERTAGAPQPDHSMYMRPQGADTRR